MNIKRDIINIIMLSIITPIVIQAEFGSTVHFSCPAARNDKSTRAIDVFEQAIKEADIVVVDFYASWCGPCKQLGPRIDQLAKEMRNVKFLKVDVDAYETLATKYKVKSMPTLLFFKKGVLKKTLNGSQTKDVIKKAIAELS